MKYTLRSHFGAKLLIAGLAFFGTGISEVSAQDVQTHAIVYDETYYKQFTYEWEDEQGNPQTSNLAEPATEYNQIVAMLREIYINPLVPGFVKDPYGYSDPTDPTDPNKYIDVPYEPCIAPGNPYGMDPKMKIETPIEGATAIIIELVDGYKYDSSDTPEQMLRKIKEAHVVYNSLYIDANATSTDNPNPGYLFNFVGMLDKFFVLTKGNNRIADNSKLDDDHPDILVGHAPFYNMFEEFSPSNKGPIYDAYPDMSGGTTFQVDHNCTSIMGQNHIIVMSPEDIDKEYPMNFMFFLPDYRFAGDSRKPGAPEPTSDAQGYEYYTYYSEKHMPYFFFNTLKAEIPSAPVNFVDQNGVNKSKVEVQWESTYNEAVGFKADEEFFVYRVENDVIQPEPIGKDEYEIDPEFYKGNDWNVEVMDDGALVTNKRLCQIFVYENRNELSRDVYYIVKGRRYPSQFDLVESNTVNTRITGYAGMENLCLKIEGRPKSTYDKATERNIYENDIFVTDTETADADMVLRAKHIHARDAANGYDRGTTFSLRRYEGDNVLNSVEVASMEVISREAKGEGTSWAVYVYTAEVSYPDGTKDTVQFKSAKNRPGTDFDEGEQPIIAVDEKTLWTDPVNKTGKIYGILAEFKDRFNALTRYGDQAPSYHYYMVYTPAAPVSPSAPAGSNAYSNVVDVAVPVRDLRVGYIPYTEEQILADNSFESMLPVNKEGIMFETRSNPYLASYTIYDYTSGKKLVEANRMPTGQLQISRRNTKDRMIDFSKENHANWTYVPVELGYPVNVSDEMLLVLTYNNGNTYGNRLRRLHGRPEAKILGNDLSYTRENGLGEHTYTSILGYTAINLEGPDDESPYEVLDFRLWGKHGAQDEYQLLSGFASDVTDAPMRVRAYSSDSDEHQYTHTFDTYEATVDNPVSFTHQLRLYAKLPQSLSISTSDEPGYIVSDKTHEASLTDMSIVTGIDTILSPSDETYRYFDTMGRELNPLDLPKGVVIRAGRGEVVKIIN